MAAKSKGSPGNPSAAPKVTAPKPAAMKGTPKGSTPKMAKGGKGCK